jgi:hypothetical protein
MPSAALDQSLGATNTAIAAATSMTRKAREFVLLVMQR